MYENIYIYKAAVKDIEIKINNTKWRKIDEQSTSWFTYR